MKREKGNSHLKTLQTLKRSTNFNTLDKMNYFVPSAKMDLLLKSGFGRDCGLTVYSNMRQNND